MGWVQAGIELGEEFLNLPIFSGHALHLFLGPFMPFQLPDSSLSIPLVVLYALTVFSLVLFICLYLRERRSVFVGWLLIATVGLLGTSLGVTAIVAENQILLVLAFLIVIGPAILSIFTPLGLTGLFLYSGVRLIVREGFSLTNSLALAAGIALIVGPFFAPGPAENTPLGGVWGTIYFYFSLVLTYFTIYAVGFTVSAVLNLVNFRQQADYVVVLGSGLMGDRVTPLLAGRIDRGIEIYRKNPGSKLIMSGGQGPDEDVPEGVAMTRYAVSRGIPETDIIVEDRAVNTRENLLFSYALMPEVAEGKNPESCCGNNQLPPVPCVAAGAFAGPEMLGCGGSYEGVFCGERVYSRVHRLFEHDSPPPHHHLEPVHGPLHCSGALRVVDALRRFGGPGRADLASSGGSSL